ncbi:hypothetical protein I302_102670 [Kwoniella bestiolae CBS 10118]|uniref:NADH:flavin oxidoreductase/NADH oxidase N-terminal domain-containing protein n=1 Tax=Kwoniella bestiolae CBS 10118 TaxID=1296100 RepID=A0A1B9GFW4_9TREE|nr:hypothetical protein I302_01364 [Kwoniella bestiolae CBS 10118]OCF29851.1 hypothetical protein I302_01364 [Kwoniella bestiolae CBS 10118]
MSLISPTPSLNGLIIKKLPQFNVPPEGADETTRDPLFTPIKMGEIELKHRIVMCPLTRHRADEWGVHSQLGERYYEQRSSDGGLIISQGTVVAHEAGGEGYVPGIYSDEQIIAWKRITDKVHGKGGKIICQLWALGRVANPLLVDTVYAPSDIPCVPQDPTTPHLRDLKVMTHQDIQRFVDHYGKAAGNAMNAGFDGIEIHGANGYLIDQFLQTNSNTRTDTYGGSLPHRIRFLLQILEAVSQVVSQGKIGLKIFPFSTFQGMRMDHPLDTFVPLLERVLDQFPNLSYIHLVEGNYPGDSLMDLRRVVEEKGDGTGVIVAGEYTPGKAREVVARDGGALGFGRYFISNPDLPYRIKKGLPLNDWDERTFYTRGGEGYIE